MIGFRNTEDYIKPGVVQAAEDACFKTTIETL
jgi:hypothetical protein